MVTGLLLPIWKRLPVKNPRVYRFETDRACPGDGQGPASGGERVIGRVIPPEALDQFSAPANPLSPEEAWSAVTAGRHLRLAGDLALRRVNIIHAPRLDFSGFNAEAVSGLKAIGLVSEIISWKLRLFVPMGEDGPRILATLLDRYPAVGDAPV